MASPRRQPTHPVNTFSDTYGGIRDDTALLSDMLLPTPISDFTGTPLISPSLNRAARFLSTSISHPSDDDLSDDFPSSPVNGLRGRQPWSVGEATPRAQSPATAGRSVLSMLLARDQNNLASRMPPDYMNAKSPGTSDDGGVTPTQMPIRQDEEEAPLLRSPISSPAPYGAVASSSSYAVSPSPDAPVHILSVAKQHMKLVPQYLTPKALGRGATLTVQALPAVLLGLLLNVLDGISYGLVIFSVGGGIFSGFGSMGVSMFFVT